MGQRPFLRAWPWVPSRQSRRGLVLFRKTEDIVMVAVVVVIAASFS